jgi:malate/lactate dehydrogenase
MKRQAYSEQEIAFIQESAQAGKPLEDIRKEILEKFGVNRPESAIKVFAKKVGVAAHKLVKTKGGKTTVSLVCVTCGKTREINTTQPEIYTPEVRKTWTCSLCPKKTAGNQA